ncbi:MBG domain-containing protein [Stenotrophomonas sp.]|uniref:MBG domain-containing protein n=1 Tax=Stenotrophomonas sp. TaxID=69392 RepID=UPI0028A6BD44|nr:MBG domain-containing protein [Stenotrophomonas sp.]
MNRIYRLVFNAALGQIQVAAEFANAPQRPATRSTRAGRLLPSLLVTAVFAAMAPAVQAADLPTGFAAVQNSATISQNDSTMTITQNGKVSLINWTGFDIASGSTVTFNMPSAAAGSINIISGAASVINGSLSSNGNVFLVNTNGIVFNSGSKVNVGGLLATSLPPIMSNLDVSASASLPAVWTFTGSGTPGAIINRGSIDAATGGVSLIGAIVENSGAINAAGTASLLAANSVNSIFMQPAAPSANDAGTWMHSLTAQSAGGVAASAINNTGYLSAASVDMKSMVQSGTFFFGINSTGVVQAQGIDGGSLVFNTNAPANIDFGSGTTAGSISSESTALTIRGTATANYIGLASSGAIDLGATLNGGNITLTGTSITQQIGQTSGALKGAVTVNTTGDATLNSTSNAITQLGGKVDGNLLLTSTTDVGQTNTLLIGGTTTLTGLARSDGRLAGFNFNNSGNQFGGTVSGGGGTLQLGSSGALRLGTFNVNSLAASGSAITLGGDVTSTGAQSYTGPVTLGSSRMLSSASGGAVSFSGTVDGAHVLTVNTTGTKTFGGAVGGATALSSLQTLGTGSTVLNGNVTTSGAIGLSGNVRLGADVAITSSGNQTISLAGTVDSDGTARALTLDTGGLAILGGSVGGSSVLASLTRTGAGATQLGGSISTVGNIDLQGALNATGAATLASTSGDIHVGGLIQSTDALGLQGGDIVVDGTIAASSVAINGGTFDGAGINSSGALTVTLSEGGLVQGGHYAAGSAATFDVADDITLDNPQNQFGGSVALKGGTVKLSNQGNLILGDVDAQALAISSGGSISQSTATAINVDTTSSFTATNGITLGRGGNVFGGAVTLQASGAAQVVADGTLRFGNIDVGSLSASGTTLYLPQNLVTQGAQSWSGALLLEGDTSLSSTFGGLSFYGTLNGPHALSLDAAAGTVHLGAISTIGSLSSITAAETQLAADITTEGNLDLGRSRVQGDVALTSTAGSVRINGPLNGTTDNGDTLAITAADNVALQGETGGVERLHDLSLSGNAISTAALNIGNNLSIDSVTSLTQSARYYVGGNADFTSLGNITLQNTANQFMGDVALSGNTVQISGLGALTLSGVDATTLQASAGALLTLRDATMAQSTALTGEAVRLDSVALGQTSTVTATGGNISQTGAVGVDSASTWTATGDIVLGDGTNQFGGAVSAAGSNITLSADSALNLGSVTTTGAARLSGRGVHLGSVQAASLQVQSGAGITQSTALAVADTAVFNATGDVVLDNVNNTFAAGVQLSGRDIRIDSAGALTLAGVNATGDLRATAHAGNLLQSAVVNVKGRSDLAASGNVQLDTPGNTFDGAIAAQGQSILLRADGGLDVESLRNGSNGAVQLVTTGDIDLGGTAINTGTNLLNLLSSAGQVRTATALTGSQVSITGVEGIRIGGDITANSLSLVSSRNNVEQQAGRIQSVTTLLGAGQGDLLLENTSNRFTGVTSLSGRDVRVAAGDLTLGMVAASRDLHLDSGGSIQQQSQMSVGRAADLRAAGDITLRHINNSFAGDVALQAAQASLYADQGLSLAQVDVDGLQATTLGLLSLRDAQVTGLADLYGASLALARADVGRLDATAFAGGITQSGAVTLGDGSELRATGNVMLDHAGNHLGSSLQVRGADVALSTLGVLDQAEVQASGLARLSGEGVQLGTVSAGSLQVYSQGDIDQGVALQVAGDSRFSASGDIRLGHAGNQFGGGVQLAGRDVRIDNAGHLRLDGVAADGDFFAVAHGGGIGQTASVEVGGRSDLTAHDDIILQQAGNTFGDAVALDASAVTLTADSNLEVDGLRTRNGGTASLEADGDLILAGNAIDLAGGSLVANATGGQLNTHTALTGNAVVLQGRDGVTVGADITGGQVVLASDVGNVVQAAGRILASGTSALVSNSGDIVIENAANRFNDSLLLIGDDIRVAAGDLQLAGVQASGDLSLTSSGNIVQTAQVMVDGTSRFTADGDITLQHADNRLDGQVQIDGRDVQIHADAGLNLQAVNARNLDAHAGTSLVLDNAIVSGDATVQGQELLLGDSSIGGNLIATSLSTIQQTAALRITGTSQFQANSDIQLGQAGNHFGGRVDINAASASIRSADSMQLGNITTTGNLQVGADAGLRLDGQIRAANVDLATAGVFDNRFGSSAIALTGQGRWQVYLASPFQNHIFGGLDSGNTATWNTAAFTHATGSDNRYLFAWQPTLTVTANTLRKIYGDSIDPSNAFSITGAMAGVTGAYLADSVTDLITGTPLLASTGASAIAGVTATPYAIDVSAGTLDTGTSGYALSFVQGELWVDPKALTITANNGGKTYGQTGGLAGFTSSGLINGDSVSAVDLGSNGSAATANVGDYTITASNADGTGLSNYDITYVDGTLKIGKAGLTITANNGGKTYGQTAGLAGFSSNGLVNGDSVSSVDLGSTGTAATANVGEYTITASNADGTGLSNYDITYVDGTLSIGKAGLTITANNGGKTYGQTGGLAGFSSNGLVNGDTVSSVDLGSTGSAATANVGNYTITASNADGTGLSNYDITYVDGTLSIGKAGLTITANNGGKTYGQTGGLAGFSSNGLLNGDSVSSVDLGSNGSAATANVGDYTITASNADGTGLSNYDITYVDGTLKIGKAGLTITANNGGKTYGQTGGLAGFSSNGLVNGDTVSSVDLGSTGSAATANVGDYTITAGNADGTGLSNYDITYVDGTLFIGKAGLTITATDTWKWIGQSLPLHGYTVNGLKNGDTIDSVRLVSAGSDASARPGRYDIFASDAVGARLGNYDIHYQGGQLEVAGTSAQAAAQAAQLVAASLPRGPAPLPDVTTPLISISEGGLRQPTICTDAKRGSCLGMPPE